MLNHSTCWYSNISAGLNGRYKTRYFNNSVTGEDTRRLVFIIYLEND